MSILHNAQREKMKPDPLVDYLTKTFDEARFDQVLPNGALFCSDSNACLDPHQMAKDIREMLGLIGSAG